MSRSEHLDAIRQGLQESVDLFSSRDKFILESYVVSEFLRNLAVIHDGNELQRGDDPPDVVFRDAKFEVKEVMDAGRRRLSEFKEALAAALVATDPAELLKDFTPKSITICEVYDEVLKRASALAACKYPASVRQAMDLLYYINLQDVMGLVEEPYPDVGPLADLGFRSVSFLDGHRSCILCSSSAAPSVLAGKLGIFHRQLPRASAT